jgi:hypothetical protein
MRAHRYNTNDLLKVLKESEIAEITIGELFKMFEAEPFFINSEEEIEKMLKYFFGADELKAEMALSFA